MMKRNPRSTVPSASGLLLLLASSAKVVLADITCGLAHGYDRGDAAYFYSGDGTLSNFDACSAECQGSSLCESFAIGDDQCLLYSAPLDTNFREQANSPFLFYDRDCQDVKATSTFLTVLPSTTKASSAGSTATATTGSGNNNDDDDDNDTPTTTTAASLAANTQIAASTGATDSGDSTSSATGTAGASSSSTGTSAPASSTSSGSTSTSEAASMGLTRTSWVVSSLTLGVILIFWV